MCEFFKPECLNFLNGVILAGAKSLDPKRPEACMVVSAAKAPWDKKRRRLEIIAKECATDKGHEMTESSPEVVEEQSGFQQSEGAPS